MQKHNISNEISYINFYVFFKDKLLFVFVNIQFLSGFACFITGLFSGKNKLFLTTFLAREKHPENIFGQSSSHAYMFSIYVQEKSLIRNRVSVRRPRAQA